MVPFVAAVLYTINYLHLYPPPSPSVTKNLTDKWMQQILLSSNRGSCRRISWCGSNRGREIGSVPHWNGMNPCATLGNFWGGSSQPGQNHFPLYLPHWGCHSTSLLSWGCPSTLVPLRPFHQHHSISLCYLGRHYATHLHFRHQSAFLLHWGHCSAYLLCWECYSAFLLDWRCCSATLLRWGYRFFPLLYSLRCSPLFLHRGHRSPLWLRRGSRYPLCLHREHCSPFVSMLDFARNCLISIVHVNSSCFLCVVCFSFIFSNKLPALASTTFTNSWHVHGSPYTMNPLWILDSVKMLSSIVLQLVSIQ